MNHSNAQLISYAVTAVIVVGVLYLRLRRLATGRRLRLEWLWVIPTLLMVFAIASLAQAPPVGLEWAWMIAALAAGAALGWYRGRMMEISVDPQTHALNTKASPAAILFILAIVLVRFGLRAVLATETHAWGLKAALITDGFILFALGLFGVQRLEMALRARRLLVEARARR